MPQHIAKTVYAVHIFEGTVASCTTQPAFQPLGGKQLKTQEKTGPGAYSADVETYLGPDGRTLAIGDVYLAEAIETAPGVFTYGPWVYDGHQSAEHAQRYDAVNPSRVVLANPGDPMRNPHGWVLQFPDPVDPTLPSVTIAQPASGDPNGRDPWTGALTGSPQP